MEVELDIAAFLPEGVELAVGAEGPELVDEAELEAEEDEGLGAGAEPSARPSAAAGGLDAAALDELERDLDGVDAAIERLDAGTYGFDAAGAPIDDALLAEDPTRTR